MTSTRRFLAALHTLLEGSLPALVKAEGDLDPVKRFLRYNPGRRRDVHTPLVWTEITSQDDEGLIHAASPYGAHGRVSTITVGVRVTQPATTATPDSSEAVDQLPGYVDLIVRLIEGSAALRAEVASLSVPSVAYSGAGEENVPLSREAEITVRTVREAALGAD